MIDQGSTINGRYGVDRHLGDGGMDTVYLGHDILLGRDVAIKVLRGNYAMDTLGYILLKNGQKEDAKRLLERAVALFPDNPSVHYHLALVYRETQDKGKAKIHLAKAIEKKDFPEYEKATKLLQELRQR